MFLLFALFHPGWCHTGLTFDLCSFLLPSLLTFVSFVLFQPVFTFVSLPLNKVKTSFSFTFQNKSSLFYLHFYMTSISNVALFTLLLHFLPCIWKHQIIDTSLENERFLIPFPTCYLWLLMWACGRYHCVAGRGRTQTQRDQLKKTKHETLKLQTGSYKLQTTNN